MELKPLIPIGSTITVDKSKINKEISKDLLDKLPQKINAQIIDYKMTDGMSIGYVLLTENKLKIWIFDNELNEVTKKNYNIDESSKDRNQTTNINFIDNLGIKYELNGTKTINNLLNPFNLLNWLIFTLKDII